ncbi:MAG: flavin reductase family protein [Rhodospirillales bacterium]
MADFDPALLAPDQQYRLVAGTVVPRPIALVTTVRDGVANAAPFSFFNMVGVDPPMLMISVAPRPDRPKDTVRNIEASGEFVVNIVSRAVAERMNACAASLSPERSEIDVAGFLIAPSLKVAPPRLVECPAQFECKVLQILKLGRKPNTMIVGEVVHFHYRDGLVNEKYDVDAAQLDAVGRISGAGLYARLTDTFTMVQPP